MSNPNATNGFQSVSTEYMKIDTLPQGDYIQGTYKGTSPNQFKPEAPNYKLQLADGRLVVVNTCGSLQKKMEHVREGDEVQIYYLGKDVLKDGKFKGKEAHKVDVRIKRA